VVDQLDYIRLNYQVDGPLTYVITPRCLEQYSRLFTFLLKLRRVSAALRDVWLVFNDLRAHAPRDPRMHVLHIFRYVLLDYV